MIETIQVEVVIPKSIGVSTSLRVNKNTTILDVIKKLAQHTLIPSTVLWYRYLSHEEFYLALPQLNPVQKSAYPVR